MNSHRFSVTTARPDQGGELQNRFVRNSLVGLTRLEGGQYVVSQPAEGFDAGKGKFSSA